MIRLSFFVLTLFFVNCKGQVTNNIDLINSEGKTIVERFAVPAGYKRILTETNSFASYLRNLPLKEDGSYVLYYSGERKVNRNVYAAVIDMKIGKRDLQQCADAIMRLRGEYLYHTKKYNEIHFNFLSDGKPRYYKNYIKGDTSYSKFLKYMDYIFAYANTGSLCDEMISIPIDSMQIGDVFIQKGRPYGHAVIVVDMAEDKTSGENIYMLAQSYMPAQETQILVNRNNNKFSPWYKLKPGIISTPEWEFSSDDLKRFK